MCRSLSVNWANSPRLRVSSIRCSPKSRRRSAALPSSLPKDSATNAAGCISMRDWRALLTGGDGLRRIALPRLANEVRVIAGPEAKHVKSRYGRNGLDVGESFRRFDLKDDELLAEAVVDVIGQGNREEFGIGIAA